MKTIWESGYFCGWMMTTYYQTVIFGHLVHRVSFPVTPVGVHEVSTTSRVGPTIANCRFSIGDLITPSGAFVWMSLSNRQSAIGGPTRYREVVLTSWDRCISVAASSSS